LWRILSPRRVPKTTSKKKREKRGNADYGILLEGDVRRRTRKRRRDDDNDEGKKKRKLGSDNFLPDNFKIKI
jgi:hypothetical protein